MPHYHPNINPSREKLQSQAVKMLHSSFTGSSKLKGSASDTLRRALQKKDELCKISLNIALQMSVSHMPIVSSLRHDINRNALTLAQCGRGKLIPVFFFYSPLLLSGAEPAPVGFRRKKLLEIRGEETNKICIWRVDWDNIRGS